METKPAFYYDRRGRLLPGTLPGYTSQRLAWVCGETVVETPPGVGALPSTHSVRATDNLGLCGFPYPGPRAAIEPVTAVRTNDGRVWQAFWAPSAQRITCGRCRRAIDKIAHPRSWGMRR